MVLVLEIRVRRGRMRGPMSGRQLVAKRPDLHRVRSHISVWDLCLIRLLVRFPVPDIGVGPSRFE